MRILVTGAAGFIGFHLARRLIRRDDEVVALDNFNPYYDVALKKARVEKLKETGKLDFVTADLTDRKAMDQVFQTGRFDAIVNLAAQAGVRYSIQNPRAYIDANIVGFANILEGARNHTSG